MKKLNLLMMTVCSIWMLQSCSNGAKTNSTTAADSSNKAKMTDSSAATTAITVNKDDAAFAVKAANGGMTEVQVSTLAGKQTTNAKIKDFASMMVTDHTKANNELMALAKSKNITLPDSISNDNKKAVMDLSKKTGADFDKAYVAMMLDDHKKTVSLFEDESKNAKDPDIKAFVDKTLPTLKMHLTNIQAISNGMK